MSPPKLDRYTDALDRLYRRARHGIRPGLERTEALMERMNHPHRAFLSIHVAGTNGKGSVCAIVEAGLRAAGFRTGLYTSPHLVRFNERFRIQGRPIPDPMLHARIDEGEEHATALDRDPAFPGPCTFFELSTAIAFESFRLAEVDVAVLETGMGGRWDATNIVQPLFSVITDIDIDHAEYLGTTVEAIAAEKAGIIKPGRPILCGADSEAAVAVIEAVARRCHAPLIRVRDAVSVRRGAQDWSGQKLSVDTPSRSFSVRLPLVGEHQARNLAIAVAALEQWEAETGRPLPDEAFRHGPAQVEWPARIQRLERDPPVILDGSHNPHAARALAHTLRALAGARQVHLVAGMLADKDAEGFARALAPETRTCRTVPVPFPRGRDPADLANAFRTAGLDARPAPDLDTALADAKAEAAATGGVVCIAGSLYLAADVLRRYGGNPLFEGGPA